MDKIARCRDVGLECDFEVHSRTEEELIERLAEHVESVHEMDENPIELAERIVAASREKDEQASSVNKQKAA